MATQIEFYERLRQHIPDEAARMIAEEMTTEAELAKKIDNLATKADMFRWMLVFFLPLWAGVYGTLIALLLVPN